MKTKSMAVAINGNGTITGTTQVAGNSDSATKLKTARTINGVAFDGTKNITIQASGNITISAPVKKTNANSGTCSKNTFVRLSCSGNVKEITINGVNVGNDRTYHDEQGHGTFFVVPADGSWSVGNTGNGSINGVYYMEIS